MATIRPPISLVMPTTRATIFFMKPLVVLAMLMMYGGWTLGIYASRHRGRSGIVGLIARLWEGGRFAVILALTFGSCLWLQFAAPTFPSLILLVALAGCALAGYDFERANSKQLL